MIDYDAVLSRAGRKMQQSEIRKMGTLLTEVRDVVSFAPGYPDPALFRCEDLAAITADLLRAGDGHALAWRG